MLNQNHTVMNIGEVRNFALTLPGATEDMPYGPDWLIFRIEGKIFLHIWLEAPEPTCAVKLLPEEGVELREHSLAVCPAYHLNKVHWNDLFLNDLDEAFIRSQIEKSYHLVLSHLPKAVQSKYKGA